SLHVALPFYWIDALVGRRDLVENRRGVGRPPLDARHGLGELLHREQLACGAPGVVAARPVRRGVERVRVAQAGHHVGPGTHGAGDEPAPTRRRVDRALAGEPDLLAEVPLPLG